MYEIIEEENMKVKISSDENGNTRLKLKNVDKPDIRFIYSPNLLKLPENIYRKFSENLVNLSTDEMKLEIIEDKYQPRNDFPDYPDIKLEFVSYQALLYFINKKDEKFYEDFKFIINDIAAARNDDPDLIMIVGLHLSFKVQQKDEIVNATFAILNKDLEINNRINQRIEHGIQYISELRNHIKIQNVLMAATENWPYWKFLGFNSSDGTSYQSGSKNFETFLQY